MIYKYLRTLSILLFFIKSVDSRCIIRQIIKSEVIAKISKSEVTTITTKY